MTHLFIVRLYDGFDNEWMDVSDPVTRTEAEEILAEKTGNGTKNTGFRDIDYYRIFPADTKMRFSEGRGEEAIGREQEEKEVPMGVDFDG